MAFDLWQQEGIHHAHVVRGEHEVNGTALILVYAHGDNSIVVYPGAGAGLTPGHVLAAQPMLACAKVVVASCEVPLPAAQLAFEVARQHGVLALLNLATAIDIPDALWWMCFFTCPSFSKLMDFLEK